MKFLKLLLLNFILIAVIICIFEIITFKLWTSPNKNYISSVFHSQSVDEYFTSLYKGDEVSNVIHSSFRKDLNQILPKNLFFLWGVLLLTEQE